MAKWFSQGGIFAEWKSAGALLWIYGKRAFVLLFRDNTLITVCVISWLWKKHSLVRRHLISIRAKSSLLYPLQCRTRKIDKFSSGTHSSF